MKSSPILVSTAVLGIAAVGSLTGPHNSHPGRLVVIEEGACADLLLGNGDPIADSEKNFGVIMKD